MRAYQSRRLKLADMYLIALAALPVLTGFNPDSLELLRCDIADYLL